MLAIIRSQKRNLIFVKEINAIDNSTYRQLNSVVTLKASADLRDLRKKNILNQKGKDKATYYVPGKVFVSTLVKNSTPPLDLSTPPEEGDTIQSKEGDDSTILHELIVRFDSLKKREHDAQKVRDIILDLCEHKFYKASQIADILSKREDYIKKKFLGPMVAENLLEYLHPEILNHPVQAYRKIKK